MAQRKGQSGLQRQQRTPWEFHSYGNGLSVKGICRLPLVHVDVGLLADDVGVAAADTLDGGEREHDLLLAIDVGVEQTQDVLELLPRDQRLHANARTGSSVRYINTQRKRAWGEKVSRSYHGVGGHCSRWRRRGRRRGAVMGVCRCGARVLQAALRESG